MKSARLWLLALALAAGAAAAGDRYVPIEQRLSAEQRHATGIDTLTPAQLEALNVVLRGDRESIVAETVKEEQARNPAGGSLAGFNDEPIRSRLKGEVAGWAPGTVFELENGQRWTVLKGEMKLRKPMQGPEILVVPGLAGRWFLQVDEDLPKARVYRVD
jgi:hypothetical protein